MLNDKNNCFRQDTELKILAHRGLWTIENEKNTIEALRNALEEGFGIETDIRDCCGEIVISHNPPKGNEPRLVDILCELEECKRSAEE